MTSIDAVAVQAKPVTRLRLRGPAVWPLHPILFAAASVLVLYASNLRETTFAGVAMTLAAMLVVGFALLLLFALAFRTLGPRAAILASIVLVAMVYHQDLYARFDRLLIDVLPNGAATPVTLAVAGFLMLVTALTRADLTLPNALLNGIAFVLCITPLLKVASYEWDVHSLGRPEVAASSATSSSPGQAFAAPIAANTPDIYYLVFDRYGSEHTLARIYGFDNRPFLDKLRAKGFYVASGSHSNYPKTAPSLASSLHMDYLDFLRDDPLARRNEWHPIYNMLQEHEVGTFLKSKGYRFIQVGGWWAPIQNNPAADENYDFGFSEFGWLFLRRTMLPRIVEAVTPGTNLAKRLDWDNAQCQRVPRQFEAIKAIGERPEVTFTFAHILVPHEPYVFDSKGRCMPLGEVGSRGQIQGYVGQLIYANSQIEEMVESLLSRPEKPIVILQADEGPYPEPYRLTNRDWTIATPGELATKTGILNAYFFPDGNYSALYDTITPVNTFRVLFDKYFGTSFGLLPDRIFAFPGYLSLYDFFEVTEAARQGDRHRALPNLISPANSGK
jgi:hypothetical protein